MLEIREVNSATDYAFAKQLILDYAAFLDINFDFQNLEQELAQLPQMYGAPKGAMLLAFDAETLAGGIGLRDLGNGYGEMKRLFVYPQFQGKGVGKALMQAFLQKSRELGYSATALFASTPCQGSIAPMGCTKSLAFGRSHPTVTTPFPTPFFWS